MLKKDSSLPKSEYLLASRRAYSMPNLHDINDILETVNLTFSEDNIENILKNRFDINLTQEIKEKIEKSGFSTNRKINIKNNSHLEKYKELLISLEIEILSNASKEREDLLKYLERKGLKEDKKIAIIDIGHNGSLQKNLKKLLNKDISGYYFMTFLGAKTLLEEGSIVKGYLSNFEDNIISYHPYCKNIGMFEFLFLPPEDTFIKFYDEDPIFVNLNESKRKELSTELHRGIINFSKNYLKVINGDLSYINYSPARAIRNYIAYLKEPGKADASMLKNVYFVDLFGGRAKRYLIDRQNYKKVTNKNYTNYLQDSWWREGAAALINNKEISIKNRINKNSELSSFQRKLRKLKRSPLEFFRDMKVFK